MLYPFWGKNPEDPHQPTSGRYDHYVSHGRGLFKMTSLEDSDIAVLPFPWEDTIGNPDMIAAATDFTTRAVAAGKKVLLFYWHDLTDTVCLTNSVIFRTSLYASHRKNNEFAMPAWSEDFVNCYLSGKVVERKKSIKPVVGFCGTAGPLHPPVKYRVKNIVKNIANTLGLGKYELSRPLRARALANLEADKSIRTNYLLRDRFLGVPATESASASPDMFRRLRIDYVKNMVESDYILCVRGAGNFSYRLYETLSCGRIPVLINTDCSLPFDSLINYKDYFVWVEENDLAQIGERVSEFHQRLSPDEFIDLQHNCRKLWESYLSPYGFFSHIHVHLRG